MGDRVLCVLVVALSNERLPLESFIGSFNMDADLCMEGSPISL